VPVSRAPQEVLVVKAQIWIVPAAVAGVIVDDPVGRCELVGRMCEARDHHDGGSHRPSEPRQSAGEPDKEFRVLEPARALSQWAVASFILGAVGDVVPDEPAAVYRLLVDADHAITRLLEEGHDLVPAHRVIPVFGLGRALHPDADIGLGDRSALVGKLDIRRHFGWVDAKYVTGGAVQPDMAEVAGLVHGLLVVEEQAYAVGRVILLRLDFLVRA